MKRHPTLAPLSRDHHRLLILAQVVRSNAPAYPGMPTDAAGKQAYALRTYEDVIVQHIRREEEILFPAISGINEEIDQLIYILKDDHCEIDQMVKTIQGDAKALHVLEELSDLLIRHIRMEERELFEAIQTNATDAIWVRLLPLLQNESD